MKLNVNFKYLHYSVVAMGATKREFILNLKPSTNIDSIDIDLSSGISISLDDIEYTDNGLLSYKGRQVLLYIQDHGERISATLENGEKGNKFHVSNCRTLKEMHESGRYERYRIKNDISGKFSISGFDSETNTPKEGIARLKVCRNCLGFIDYKGYQNGSDRSFIFDNFSLDDFFTRYQSDFKHKPKRYAGKDNDAVYPADWGKTSKKYRESVNWKCESCGKNFCKNRGLLHTHHRNGVKSDSSRANLQVLCIECHANQPGHEHMVVTLDQRQILDQL